MNKKPTLSPYLIKSNKIAVDFDNTITNRDGSLNKKAVKYLYKIKSLGVDLVLWTARKNERYQEAVNFCKENNIPVIEDDSNLMGKLFAIYYIDDRSVPGGKVHWYATYRYIKKEVEHLNKIRKQAGY